MNEIGSWKKTLLTCCYILARNILFPGEKKIHQIVGNKKKRNKEKKEKEVFSWANDVIKSITKALFIRDLRLHGNCESVYIGLNT